MDDHEKNLRAAIKRLAASNTRIKRRHARAQLRSVLGKISKDLMNKYPIICKDGSERRQPKRPVCPVCGVPCKNWSALAKHCGNKHGRNDPGTKHWVCWCGATAYANYGGCEWFARHLAAIKDLKAHILLGVLKSTGV